MNPKLKTVIDDYLDAVKQGMALFVEKVGDTPPLVAWKEKQIPQKGNLSKEVEYQFHGIGCLLIFSDYEVDFDFGPDDRFDGFDLWRLGQYVSSRLDKYPDYQDEDRLEHDFDQAIKGGEISKLDHPYCRLYFYA